jgi:hypothetical protein
MISNNFSSVSVREAGELWDKKIFILICLNKYNIKYSAINKIIIKSASAKYNDLDFVILLTANAFTKTGEANVIEIRFISLNS